MGKDGQNSSGQFQGTVLSKQRRTGSKNKGIRRDFLKVPLESSEKGKRSQEPLCRATGTGCA